MQCVRDGQSVREVAARFRVSTGAVCFWVARARGRGELGPELFANRKPGRAWNRTPGRMEQRILRTRQHLHKHSILGEFGADAIHGQLGDDTISRATINRVLKRLGATDHAIRVRRPPPPRGWYLPAVAAGNGDLDSFDFIEDLKLADGPLFHVLTGKNHNGALTDAWVFTRQNTGTTCERLLERWGRDGLPAYAQFDNHTVFQGPHQFAHAVGQVSRLCLALGVIPVFAPPLEHGLQNSIENFNGLWQAKVWQRHRMSSLAEVQRRSNQYIAQRRSRSDVDGVPRRRPLPKRFVFNPKASLKGQLIYIRRTNEQGQAHLLAQRFMVSPDWPHRLVRCEIDFDQHCIRFFALRRRLPEDQPLLKTVAYFHPSQLE